MKIDLQKLETALPRWSASKFPFSAVSLLSSLFYISQIRLLVTGCPSIKLKGKLNAHFVKGC